MSAESGEGPRKGLYWQDGERVQIAVDNEGFMALRYKDGLLEAFGGFWTDGEAAPSGVFFSPSRKNTASNTAADTWLRADPGR